ncbi:MAG: hypothetical protein JO180_12495 [Gemmatirosa sp.]|nr:hypothetical protein [Gemmatirosa sp.]
MTTLTMPVRLATAYAPPTTSRAALNADCLAAIIAGRALPESVRPAAFGGCAPSTAREGIERALYGRAAAH